MAQVLALGVIAVSIVAFAVILVHGIRSSRRAPMEPAIPS
jgi:hypothetical protein